MLRFLQFLKDYIALCQEILSRPDPEAEAEWSSLIHFP